MCRGLLERGQHVVSYDVTPFPDEEETEGLSTIVGDIRDGLGRHVALNLDRPEYHERLGCRRSSKVAPFHCRRELRSRRWSRR